MAIKWEACPTPPKSHSSLIAKGYYVRCTVMKWFLAVSVLKLTPLAWRRYLLGSGHVFCKISPETGT